MLDGGEKSIVTAEEPYGGDETGRSLALGAGQPTLFTGTVGFH